LACQNHCNEPHEVKEEIIFKGCFAEVSNLVDMKIQKFFYHMTHHRVMQHYREAGIIVSSSTVNDWRNKTCDLLLPLYNTSRRHLMKSLSTKIGVYPEKSPMRKAAEQEAS